MVTTQLCLLVSQYQSGSLPPSSGPVTSSYVVTSTEQVELQSAFRKQALQQPCGDCQDYNLPRPVHTTHKALRVSNDSEARVNSYK